MSKSLEALERLCKVKIYQKEASAYDYLGKEIYKEEINTIKQDLERLEEINKVWLQNEPMESVDFKAYQLQILYDYINVKEKENQELKDKSKVLEQSVKDTYDTSQEIIADLKEEKERWRKLCLCWRKAYIECDEKFHNLCKEVLK